MAGMTDAEKNARDQAYITNAYLGVIKDNEAVFYAQENKPDIPYANRVNEAHLALTQGDKPLFSEIMANPDNAIKIMEAHGVDQGKWNENYGRAFLDEATSEISSGAITSKDASKAFANMRDHYNQSGALMMSGITREVVVLWPEHRQYLNDPDSMSPELRLRAAGDLARIETVMGKSLADEDGNVRTDFRRGDGQSEWPNDGIITKERAEQNRADSRTVQDVGKGMAASEAPDKSGETSTKELSASAEQSTSTAEKSSASMPPTAVAQVGASSGPSMSA